MTCIWWCYSSSATQRPLLEIQVKLQDISNEQKGHFRDRYFQLLRDLSLTLTKFLCLNLTRPKSHKMKMKPWKNVTFRQVCRTIHALHTTFILGWMKPALSRQYDMIYKRSGRTRIAVDGSHCSDWSLALQEFLNVTETSYGCYSTNLIAE